ncbi:Leucine--tRNA ligase [compost metagenome]
MFEGPILESAWPAVDSQALCQDEVKVMVQVNGRLRGNILVKADADQAEIRAMVLSDASLRHHLEGRSGKMVVVPNRLVNFIV